MLGSIMRRRTDPFEKPWVIIAAVIGIIAVVVIALVFFMGGVPSGEPSSASTTNPSGQQNAVVGVAPSVTMTQKPVTVPTEGVFVKVSYIGGFSGTYGANGVMQKVRNSGTRLYEITNETGNVSATFIKEDGSTKHDITVELWKNGKSLTSARNSTPFGTASINYKI